MDALDSHLHLWDTSVLDYPWLEGPLDARFGPDELRAALDNAPAPSSFVFVQADAAEGQAEHEVEWVASLADQVGVRGIVAGARLDRGAETEAQLDRLAAHPLVVGVRHLLQGEPDGFARSDAFVAGARSLAERGLAFDACVRGSAQLRDVIALATAVPNLAIVLDHLGKPEVGTAEDPFGPSGAWRADLLALGEHPQVFCKLSGLPAEAGGSWTPEQVEPFFDAAAVAFGDGRLMYGSDWPVSAVTSAGWSGEEGEELDALAIPNWTATVAGWADDRGFDVRAILRGNAERFYGVD